MGDQTVKAIEYFKNIIQQFMEKRIPIQEIEPGAYQSMLALGNLTKKFSVSAELQELIKIRASQMNGCSFCLDMHGDEAIKIGIPHLKLLALSAWRESHHFTAEEKTVLLLTEELTKLDEHGVKDDTYQQMVQCYGEKITSQIIMQIVVINSWNRIAISTRAVYKKSG